MNLFFLDASFLLSALLSEKSSSKDLFYKLYRQAQTKEVTLYSQELILLEISNALNTKKLSPQTKAEFLDNFSKLPITYLALRPTDFNPILTQATLFKTNTFQASYHFMAKTIGATLLTCDKAYYQATKLFGNIQLI